MTNWTWFVLSFLASGWLVALYFAINPSFIKMMNEVPPGTILNVVPPTIYLMLALALNMIGFMISILDNEEKVLE
jgi:hypothetical protein